MNIAQLECFLAVADELHFGRAAERLHRSPATVSEAVAALERGIGGKLFARTSRRVTLTPEGARFLQEVREPFEALLRAHARASARARRLRPEVVIAHTPQLGHLLLPSLQAAAGAGSAPALPVWRPVLMHTHEQQRAVEAGTADIGLCWSATVQPPLRSVVLRKLPIMAVLPQDDPLAREDVVAMASLRGRGLLMTPRKDNAFLAGTVQIALAQAGLNPGDVEEVERYEDLALRIRTGRLVGLHPATGLGSDRMPGLVMRPLAPGVGATICALTREDAGQDACALVDALRATARSLEAPASSDDRQGRAAR
ncbi:LysR family transcriptional regulator [Streptomyces cinereospinus]|uniref:LysR family transcriptional regulator n=1 Tax=Streptomyces cinereospinus TaxID=285561 RepID=A0ABV5MZQ1_9ACTN